MEAARQNKKQFEYEAQEEAPEDPKQKFKICFYYAGLDTAIQIVEERFQELQQCNSLFLFLYDIYKINKKYTEDVLKACKNLEKSSIHNGNKNIDDEDLCCEIAIARRLPKSMPPQGVILFIVQQKHLDSVPNVSVALLPVSVTSGKCSFSKLKLIKTYLRSTTLQGRLVGLATVSIEQAEASTTDLKESLTKFAKGKARKLIF
ncbi:hypothetical protein JRQ81_018944 [Phrynocephalus forsythii]|uniref:HAT C-terminal dimerisation domain-containing protein n=1 Tax=Phrynocephalus forsythii TaxID=171643 RepID=A0A9Q0XPI5_9SAUR|nr:hypothetical protein JRQ81_018944 [Phrynocephalus forsythii]